PLNFVDPTSGATPPPPLQVASNPTVAFDRAHNFYLVYSEHNTDQSANGSGTATYLMLDKWSLAGTTAVASATVFNKQIYATAQQDQAVNPTLVIDTTLPNFTDPDTNAVQVNQFSGTMYVAWNSNYENTTNPAIASFNPNTIKIIASSDGGVTFSGERYV